MQAKQIVARVEELVKPLCEQAGVSLWDVEFEKEGGQYMLTVTVDRPEGVNIDQCEQVSRALDPMLDEKEFDDMPSYTPVSYTHLRARRRPLRTRRSKEGNV